MRIKLLNTALCLLFAASGSHAQQTDYGANEANLRFIPSQGLLGGRTDFDCLRLENHPAASGVPLGGIGAGNVQFAPDGRFVRIGLNNIHLPIRKSSGSFFTLWHRSGGTADARRLVRDSLVQYGMEGVPTTCYTGLFPRAELDPGEVFPGVKACIRAFSPLIAHNVKDSSLPLAFFEVELESEQGGEAAVAFSWEDFIGRGIREPERIEGMTASSSDRTATGCATAKSGPNDLRSRPSPAHGAAARWPAYGSSPQARCDPNGPTSRIMSTKWPFWR